MADGGSAAPLSVRDRHEAMHHLLRQRICLLVYPPGMRLSEADLAADLGISRTPLRRVLARLEDEGLVRSQHGVGTIVTDADSAELEQAYRLRIELTQLVARLDPVLPDADWRRRFDGLVAQARDIVQGGTPQSFTELDMEVFEALSLLTANLPLRETLARLYYQTKRIWLTAAMEAQIDLRAEFQIFLDELEAIQLALQSDDLDAVAHVQRAHISMSFNRLKQRGRG